MRFTTRMLFLMVVLRGSAAVAADPTIDGEPVLSEDQHHFVQKFSRGKDVIVVDVRTQAFQKAAHKLKLDEGGGVREVDGRHPFGTDVGPPEHLRTEIVSIQVSWNGTRRKLARRFYADCFNASASPRVLVSDDFGTVMLTLAGGDGAGAYGVVWTISKAGAVTRFVNDVGNF